MDDLMQKELKERFHAATESFIDKVKGDPNVIAVIICGSLAYDLVWEKSDIDMTLVVRDQALKNHSYCIIEDGITINVSLVIRSDFKRGLEKQLGGSFFQSYLAKGKIVYTTDDSLEDYFEDIKKLGDDDIALSIFHMSSELIYLWKKSLKWLTVRKDPLYAQYFLLKAAETISNMELCLHGEPLSRESIQKALRINPEAVTPFYQEAMSHHLSEAEITKTLEKMERYLEDHLDVLIKPVIEFMSDQEIKTVTLISRQFHIEGHFIIDVFEYLAEKGIIEKVSQTIRITPKGRKTVEEIGFLYIPNEHGIRD